MSRREGAYGTRRGPLHWADEIEYIVNWSTEMDIATAMALGVVVRRMRGHDATAKEEEP